MIVLIDNYDSFSYNVYQLLGQFDEDIAVIRNDAESVAALAARKPDHIVLSPGPGRPAAAGICEEVVRHFCGKVPILGICLGHQAICEAFGGTVTYAGTLMHGKQSVAKILREEPLFHGLGPEMDVGRYHSLQAERMTLPPELEILAETAAGEIMAVGHKKAPVYGVQFHPESILTPQGPLLIRNFLNQA